MKALYFGTYDREHPRNVNAIAAMREADVEVVERSARVRGRGFLGALSVFARREQAAVPRRREFDVVIVGYPGHFDVPQARRVAGGHPLVFDAVLSLEDELVGVRRRFRARSTAATVLRAVDLRALRLPDLVICGTDTEAAYLQSLGAKNVASVFLGTDEELYRHPWSPTFPFTAVHFATGVPGDGSADVVRIAASLHDVPVQIVAPGEIARDDLGIAVAHAGIVLASFRDSQSDPAGRVRRARDGSAGRDRRHAGGARAPARRRVGAARPARRPRGAGRRDRAARGRRGTPRPPRSERDARCSRSVPRGSCSAPAGATCSAA